MKEKKQMKTKKERLKEVVQWLKSEKIIKNRRHLIRLLGYNSESNFSAMINGMVNIPERFLVNLANLDNRLNVEWLRTGEGEMLRDIKSSFQFISANNIMGTNVQGNGNNVSNSSSTETDKLWLIIKQQQSEIAEQRAEIKRLTDVIVKLKTN
ncbi:MAG: hypothetical protein LBG80_15440 [Bacteroidales bacterium]|jgi:hypothetical protein|nr:hypothetical protein [Bacteroidales bacterium]